MWDKKIENEKRNKHKIDIKRLFQIKTIDNTN